MQTYKIELTRNQIVHLVELLSKAPPMDIDFKVCTICQSTKEYLWQFLNENQTQEKANS